MTVLNTGPETNHLNFVIVGGRDSQVTFYYFYLFYVLHPEGMKDHMRDSAQQRASPHLPTNTGKEKRTSASSIRRARGSGYDSLNNGKRTKENS